MAFYSFSPTLKTEKETLVKDGVTLAVVKLSLPCLPEGEGAFAKGLNGLYARISESFMNYCRGPFLKKAEKHCKTENFVPYGAVIKAVPAFENERLYSCYFDVRMSNGKSSSHSRLAQTFEKETGYLLGLETFFRRKSKGEILRLLLDDARTRGDRGILPLYSDYGLRLRKCFNSRSYYLSPTGFVIYYGEGELSGAKGISPLFVSLENCISLLSEKGKELLLTADSQS